VLVERQLLAGNVIAAQNGAAITLTSDDADNTMNVYRLNASTVEIDGLAGTTINGVASVMLANSGVSDLTVNLGSGYDSFDIADISTKGNINVNGPSFAAGSAIFIHSETGPMTIGGSIVAKLGAQNATNVDFYSYFYVKTGDNNSGHGDLTVLGSISVTESNVPGYGYLDVETFAGAGNLTVDGSINYNLSGGAQPYCAVASGLYGDMLVKGSVNVFMSGAGGDDEFELYTLGSNLTVNGAVNDTVTGDVAGTFHAYALASRLTIGKDLTCTMTASGSTEDEIYTNGGDIAIGGSVVQSALHAASANNSIDSEYGNINIAQSVTQTGEIDSGIFFGGPQPDISNWIFTDHIGDITIGGSVTMNNTGGFYDYNEIYIGGIGNITIGARVTINDSAATFSTYNEVFTNGSGNLAVGLGGVTINQSSSSPQHDCSNQVFTNGVSPGFGDLTVRGLITIKAANSAAPDYADNLVGSEGGSGVFSAAGVVIEDSGSQDQHNEVYSDFGPVKIGVLGVRIIGTGTGAHYNNIHADTDAGSSIVIAGSVIVVDKTTGQEKLEIDGSLIKGSLIVTMPGNGAEIDINNGNGYQTTEIRGVFIATMRGTNPIIYVANGTGTGYSHVRIDAGVVLFGKFRAGATMTYKRSNVTTPVIVPVFFKIVKT
jgi:hypothetical protein